MGRLQESKPQPAGADQAFTVCLHEAHVIMHHLALDLKHGQNTQDLGWDDSCWMGLLLQQIWMNAASLSFCVSTDVWTLLVPSPASVHLVIMYTRTAEAVKVMHSSHCFGSSCNLLLGTKGLELKHLTCNCFFVDDDVILTDLVVCLILKISMNVTLVTTPVQQNKYVSISREATHAWILYSAPLPTSKLVTSECCPHPLPLHPPSGSLTPSLHVCPLSQCMCSAENPACREKPFTILFRHMDLSSGRIVPADIFQMQATTRYPGAFYIFQIKSGNEGREFYMRVRGCCLTT